MTQDSKRSPSFLGELLIDAPCGIVVTDAQGRIEWQNDRIDDWCGPALSRDGAVVTDLFPRPVAVYFEAQVRPMLFLQGYVREISCRLVGPEDTLLPVLLSARLRRGEDGKPARVDYFIFDATERQRYEQDLREARQEAEEFAAIARSTHVGIARVDDTGVILRWNHGAEKMFGLSAADARGKNLQDIVSIDDQADWLSSRIDTFADDAGHIDFDAGSAERSLSVTISPIFGQSIGGNGRDFAVILRDITEKVVALRRQRLLALEMNHRVKNTLSVVLSIARQTFRSAENRDERDTFIKRIQSFAALHSFLVAQGFDRIQLTDLLALSTQASGPDRIRLDGPPVVLDPNSATTLSLALHELTTNAIKYGALSTENGHVDLTWSMQGQDLHLKWCESGGPPVAAPSRTGFGNALITKALEAEFGGKVTLDFRPGGVVCEMVLPQKETVSALELDKLR